MNRYGSKHGSKKRSNSRNKSIDLLEKMESKIDKFGSKIDRKMEKIESKMVLHKMEDKMKKETKKVANKVVNKIDWDGKTAEHQVVGCLTVLVSHVTNLPGAFSKTFVKVWRGSTGSKDRIELGVTPVSLPNVFDPHFDLPITRPISKAEMVMLNKYGSEDCKNIVFELYHQPAPELEPKFLGDIAITPDEVRENNGTVRDQRTFDSKRKMTNHITGVETKLAFTVSFAGVAPPAVKKEDPPLAMASPSQSSSSLIQADEAALTESSGSGSVEDAENVKDMVRVRIVKGYGFRTVSVYDGYSVAYCCCVFVLPDAKPHS